MLKELIIIHRYTTDYDYNTGIASLKIDGAQSNDVGGYLVVAENPAGKDQTNCKVGVTLMPNIDQTPIVNPDAFRFLEHPAPQRRYEEPEKMAPPKVVIPLADVKLVEGQAIQLACKIEGVPKPKVFRSKTIYQFTLIFLTMRKKPF